MQVAVAALHASYFLASTLDYNELAKTMRKHDYIENYTDLVNTV